MIAIREIDSDNIFDVCELTTNSDGIGTTMEEFLCCNATSIAESKYFPEMHPKAIYWLDTLIGFLMYRRTGEAPETAVICRFMVDHRFQHRGLGRKAFDGILGYLKEQGIAKVVLMIDAENTIAKNLYCSFGFTFTGKIDHDEYYYQRML